MLEKANARERLIEQRLCARYDWDLAIFRGDLPVSPGDPGDFRFKNADGLLFRLRPRIKALRVDRWHRFGNSVKQLLNVLYAAETLGVGTVHFAEPHEFFTGDGVDGLRLVWGPDRQADGMPSVEGSFFHLNALRLPPTPSAMADVFAGLIRPVVSAKILEADPRMREDDLVLHFRAGDVFSTPELAGSHGQPPLSFYLSAVEREQPGRVWLVFEDRSNPCIEAVEDALRSRGIEVIVQSATLADDLRVLMNARRLVAGRGSFVYWIAHLSGKLRRAYFMHKPGRMWSLRELGVEIVLAEDSDGEFEAKLLRGNWLNTPEQRGLLMSYPAEKLRFSVLKPKKHSKRTRAPLGETAR